MVEVVPYGLHLKNEIDLKLIGQEDNTLIYTWKEYWQENSKDVSTWIGILKYSDQELTKLITFNTDVNIVQASISKQKKHLAFVRILSGAEFQNGNKTNMYKAYLVDLLCSPQDQNLWHPLTDIHSHLIHCYFLASIENEESDTNGNCELLDESVLVLIHRHSIQLHKLSFKTLDKQLVDSSEVLSLDFIWSQWIPVQQTLYVLKFIGNMENIVDVKDLSDASLFWIQFHDTEKYKVMMEISGTVINLSGKYINQKQTTYMSTMNKISEYIFNLHVITTIQGNVIICCQYLLDNNYYNGKEYFNSLKYSLPLSSSNSVVSDTVKSNVYLSTSTQSRFNEESEKSNSSESFYTATTKSSVINEEVSSPSSSSDADVANEPLYEQQYPFPRMNYQYFLQQNAPTYHITILHSCKRLSVILKETEELKNEIFCFFNLEDTYIIIWSPGNFIHMIDTRLCHGANSSILKFLYNRKQLDNEIICHSDILKVLQFSKGSSMVFIPKPPYLFNIKVSISQFVLEFLTSSSMKLNIFHYFSFHTNVENIQQFISVLLHDPYSLEITALLKELILGFTLSAVEDANQNKSDLCQYFMSSLFSSYSSKETSLNEFIIYKKLFVKSIINAAFKTLPKNCKLWNNFCYLQKLHLALREDIRFCLEPYSLHVDTEDVGNKYRKNKPEKLRNFFFSAVYKLVRWKKIQHNTSSGSAIQDLNDDSATKIDPQISVQSNQILEKLIVEMKNKFPVEDHAAIDAIFKSYHSNQMVSLHDICCSILNLFDISFDSEISFRALSMLPLQYKWYLFMLLQHLQLAADQLSIMQNLSSRFCIIQVLVGFECLPFSTFMQYVNKKIIKLCTASVKCILAAKEDCPCNIEKKKVLICSLPGDQAKLLLNNWSYEWNIKYHAKNL